MKKSLAKSLSALLANNEVTGFSTRRIRGARPTTNFHPWVDGRPLFSIDRISREGGPTYFLLLTPWRDGDSWYVVVYPENQSQPLVEIHKTDADERTFLWRYAPTKRDGRNPERTAYFARTFGFGDVQIQISVPNDGESLLTFLEDLFDLVEHRLAADDLRTAKPAGRDSFPEGIAYERLHTARERSRNLVLLAKRRAMNRDGHLSCQVCEFDFAKVYGDLGRDFIEAHHTIPLSQLDGVRETRVEDLALVCSNCHRMLHRRRPWLGMKDLKDVLGGEAV
ncbi:MAG: HNH endonuclease [Chromatiaceae bacterium]|nr:HNH endonuclease [Chromatiaceae bacterium]